MRDATEKLSNKRVFVEEAKNASEGSAHSKVQSIGTQATQFSDPHFHQATGQGCSRRRLKKLFVLSTGLSLFYFSFLRFKAALQNGVPFGNGMGCSNQWYWATSIPSGTVSCFSISHVLLSAGLTDALD